MTWKAWLTVGVLALVLGLLIRTRKSPYIILLGGLTLLFTAGVVNQKDALSGMSNPGMVTVGALFAVVAGLRDTGAMNWLAEPLLGNPKSVTRAQARIMVPIAALSSFMNNTPLVAAMLPVINDWGQKRGISVSKLLIPLSYASILGGACTLIGTSTIIVVNGLILSETDLPGLGMFDLAKVGLPCAVAGITYLLVASRWLLPERRPVVSPDDDAREYTVEMLVADGSPLIGRSVEEAGLRQLPGLYLIEIEREDQVIPAVGPSFVLAPGDRLVFAGVVSSVVDLQRIRGLQPATNQVYKLGDKRANRSFVEAVVSSSCPLVGRTIREGRFRTRYNAAVIAVGRGGERLNQKLGDIVLRAGDTLLLEARASFAEQQRNSRDFYLVSRIEDEAPPRHEKTYLALALFAGMVVVATTGWLSMLNAAMLTAGLMIITGCTSAPSALRAVNLQVLLVIASAVGIGRAMDRSGAAEAMAANALELAGSQPHLILAVMMAVTMLFTNIINANASAVLMFPIAMRVAAALGVNAMPFALGIMMGATMSFATPMGYNTNLMVFGPNKYQFSDYTRLGLPLSVIVWGIGVLLIPHFWPF